MSEVFKPLTIEEIEELLGDLVNCAKDVVSCWEWGESSISLEREMEKIKKDLLSNFKYWMG